MAKRHVETRLRAKDLRANITPPERLLWSLLRSGRLGVKFQRQVVLPPYIADFASRSERLVIELDGDSHAGREAYDAARTRALEERGYRVLRFTNSEVMTNPDGVVPADDGGGTIVGNERCKFVGNGFLDGGAKFPQHLGTGGKTVEETLASLRNMIAARAGHQSECAVAEREEMIGDHGTA